MKIFLLIFLLFVLFLLFLKGSLHIDYSDTLCVYVRVLFLKIQLYPKKEKRVKVKNFSLKNLNKKREKLKVKKTKKKAKKKETEEEKSKTGKIKGILEIIKIILEGVVPKFGKHLRIKVFKMNIKVATGEPDKTAIMYGIISQSAAYIIEILSNITNVRVRSKKSINIYPDFLSDKSDAEIHLSFNLRVWHIFSLVVNFFLTYLKKNSNKNTEVNKNQHMNTEV